MQRHTNIAPYVGESWLWPLDTALTIFKDEIAPVLKARSLKLRESGLKVTPDEQNVFRAFRECPFDNVRVVIIGMDPYPAKGAATGLCFDVPKTAKKQASLNNILKEIVKDYGESKAETNVLSYLEHLPAQGVLLLNRALTTEEGTTGAHLALWKSFLEETVKGLNTKPYLVWVLWGKNAQELRPLINPKHEIIVGSHPSPFSYNPNPKTGHKGFKDQTFFRKINALMKGPQITW